MLTLPQALTTLTLTLFLLTGCASRGYMMNHYIQTHDLKNMNRELAKGVNPNLPAEQFPPLYSATVAQPQGSPEGDLAMMDLLLRYGADPNVTGGSATIPPIFVAQSPMAVELLVSAGADMDYRAGNGRTPLHTVTDPAIARTLLEFGANPELKDNQGFTALAYHQRRHAAEQACVRSTGTAVPGLAGLIAQAQRNRCIEKSVRASADTPAATLLEQTDAPLEQTVSGRIALLLEETGDRFLAESPADNHRSVDDLPLPASAGAFVSPYTRDGVTAEWVSSAINARTGSAVGSAVGAAAATEAVRRIGSGIPGIGILAGVAGSAAGKSVGRDIAIDEAEMRQSADTSFRTLNDMAHYLVRKHGNHASFAEVVRATNQVYPGFLAAVTRARRNR